MDQNQAMQEYIAAVQAAQAAALGGCGGGSGTPGPDEWACAGCGNCQKKMKLACQRCGRPRPIAGLPQVEVPASAQGGSSSSFAGVPALVGLPGAGGPPGASAAGLPGLDLGCGGCGLQPGAAGGCTMQLGGCGLLGPAAFGGTDMASFGSASSTSPGFATAVAGGMGLQGHQLQPPPAQQAPAPALLPPWAGGRSGKGKGGGAIGVAEPVFVGFESLDMETGADPGSALAAQAALAAMRNASLSGQPGGLVNVAPERPPGPPVNAKPGDWVCKQCGDLQFARNPSCRRCGATKPMDGHKERADGKPWFAEPGDWVCSGCGDLQFKRNAICRKCQTPRSKRVQAQQAQAQAKATVSDKVPRPVPLQGLASLGPPTQKSGDWMCRGCGDLQFARNTICRRCGTARPNDGAAGTPFFAEGGDWLCPGCGDLQFKRNNNCRKCGLARPKEDAPAPVEQVVIEPELSKEAEEMKEYFIALHAAEKAKQSSAEVNERTLRVNNPPPVMAEDGMSAIFRSTFQGVVECTVHTDGRSHRQFAKVVFDSKEHARRALQQAGDSMDMTLLSDYTSAGDRRERRRRSRSRSRRSN